MQLVCFEWKESCLLWVKTRLQKSVIVIDIFEFLSNLELPIIKLTCEVIGIVCRKNWWMLSVVMDVSKCEWRIQQKKSKYLLNGKHNSFVHVHIIPCHEGQIKSCSLSFSLSVRLSHLTCNSEMVGRQKFKFDI